MVPPFLSSGTPLSARLLTGGFASQPRDWFAFIGKEPSMPFRKCEIRASTCLTTFIAHSFVCLAISIR